MLPELPVLVPVPRTVTVLPVTAMLQANVPPKWLMVLPVLQHLSNWPLTVLHLCVPVEIVWMASVVTPLALLLMPVRAIILYSTLAL